MIRKFYHYIYGQHFILQTDHKPQHTIFGSKKGLPMHTANWLQKWGTILLSYYFKIEYLPLKKFGYVDRLSRLIPKYKEPLEDTMIAFLKSEGELKTTLCNTVREHSVTLEQIKLEALCNEYINQIKVNIFEKDVFSICNDILLYRENMILSTLQKYILKDFHAGHPGSTRMKSLMCSYVHWPNMDKDIENTVKSCKSCALAAKTPLIKFNPWPKTDLPWSRIPIDFTSPLEGYYYLIVVKFLEVAWSTQMQKPNYRNYYKISTWTVRQIRSSGYLSVQ